MLNLVKLFFLLPDNDMIIREEQDIAMIVSSGGGSGGGGSNSNNSNDNNISFYLSNYIFNFFLTKNSLGILRWWYMLMYHRHIYKL